MESLESRDLPATLALTAAEVRPDGRTVEVAFEASKPEAYGTPDWMPGQADGIALTTSTGVDLEQIGTVVTTTDDTLTWTATYLVNDPDDVITFGSGNVTLNAGAGLLQDDQGNATGKLTEVVASNNSLVDADGFTTDQFTRGDGGVTLYVSSSHGSDSRSFTEAQSMATPFKTPSKALSMLRSMHMDGTGSAVELLRGDTFDAGGVIQVGGQDAAHPLVIEDYWYKYTSTAKDPQTRPIIQSTSNTNGLSSWSGTGVPDSIDNVVIRDVKFLAKSTTNKATGMDFVNGGKNWTIDNCVVQRFANGIVVGTTKAPFSDVTILRTSVLDSWGKKRPQGAYIAGTQGLLISQSFFDNNGRTTSDGKGRDMYSHNIYLHESDGPAVVWGNVIRGGGSHGIQMRSGGVLAYNYLARNAIAAFIDGPGGSQYKNVVEKAEDISPKLRRGYGLGIGNNYIPGESQILEGNIIVNDNSNNDYAKAISIQESQDSGTHSGLIRNNTIYRGGTVTFTSDGGGTQSSHGSIRLQRNILDNRYGYTFLMGTDYSSYDWFHSDNNVLSTIQASPARINGHGLTYDQWGDATSGSDVHSVVKLTAYRDWNADISDYAQNAGLASSESGFEKLLRDRALGAWNSGFDASNIYQFFASAYSPKNLPGAGSGQFDYYGASDYR